MQEEITIDNSIFGEVLNYIEDDNVTDIDWNGKDLWITNLVSGKYRSEKKLSAGFVDNLAIKLSNVMNVNFNNLNRVLEANTQDRRISIFHESAAGEKSLSIRKNPLFLRLKRESMIQTGYSDEKLLNLIENCVIAHCNIIVGGLPNAGKTELVKYLTTFIPNNEKAGVYEDTKEIHYRVINPNKDCVEVLVNENTFPYTRAIKAGLRHNIKWTILSEARDKEVLQLMNSLSSGANCLTTIHADNVRSIPDRMFNMLGECSVSDRYINNIYRYLDVGILVSCDSKYKRRIEQLCFYLRENHHNRIVQMYDNGKWNLDFQLSETIKTRFGKYGILDVFSRNKITEQNSNNRVADIIAKYAGEKI